MTTGIFTNKTYCLHVLAGPRKRWHTVVLLHSYRRWVIILFPYLFPYSLFISVPCQTLQFEKYSLKIAAPKFQKSSVGLWLADLLDDQLLYKRFSRPFFKVFTNLFGRHIRRNSIGWVLSDCLRFLEWNWKHQTY